MKKLLLFFFAAFAFAACEQAPIEEQAAVHADAPEIIRVGFEDETRIQLNEAQKTVWTKGDLVSVFYRSNANQKWQYQGNTGERVGDLKRVANAEATQELSSVVVVYPYSDSYYINPKSCNVEAHLPAEQTYLKDSYGLNGNIMISQNEFNQFSLKNVCGWLKIQLKGEGQVVKKITLRGNNNEQVAGLIYINSADATITLANEQGDIDDVENGTGGNLVFDDTILTEVTLNCGEGVTLSGATSTFHIGLPPQTFEKGLTLTVEYSDGSKMTKSTSNSITVTRNTIQPMSALYYDGNLPPVFELAYTTTDGEPLDPYTTDGFGANFVENVYDATTGKGALKFDGRITTIPAKAFIACTNLTEITLTGEIKYIRAEAFSNCSKLAVMNIPNGVTSIGDKAFYNCSGIQEISIPNSVTSIGTSSFEGCGGKANINCKISNNSFKNAKFTEVIIGDSVTAIGYAAFEYCSSLTSVTIPDSVTEIGNDAFYNCSSIKEVYYTGVLSTWCKIDFKNVCANPMYHSRAKLYLNGVELTEVTIPSDITEIKYTFSGWTSLTSITIHDRVTEIGEDAFAYCSSLTSVTIPDRVTSIESSTFKGCSSLISITIPDSITSIGNWAFSGCSSLTSIPIPDRVTEIGYYAFYGCTSLTSVTIPDSVTTIGERAFGECDSLTSITIPDSVTEIGYSAFNGCESLTSITIPDRVTWIGMYAFYDCSNLKSVYCKAITPPSLGSYAFKYYTPYYYKIRCDIYVPTESVEAYKSASGWSEYADTIEGYNF